MTLILDAGALVALERGDRESWALVNTEAATGRKAVTHGGVLAQIWRGGSGRQARLSLAMSGITVRDLGDSLGRATGLLLGRSGTSDAIDAALVVLAQDHDRVLTSDPHDLAYLAMAAGKHLDILPV
ncbi:MAG: twitching motility protein PilT [Sporichthyaceae bacterium]